MICSNCGTPQQDGAKFCNSCGSEMKEVNHSASEAASAAETVVRHNTGVARVPVYPPEHGLTWSLCLTTIAGSIFFSKNWNRLGKPQHIWWTWVTGMAVLLLSMLSVPIFGTQAVGTLLYLAWIFVLYGLQRKEISKEIRSVPNRVVSGILTGIVIISLIALPNNGNNNKQMTSTSAPTNQTASTTAQSTTASTPAPATSPQSTSTTTSNAPSWNTQDLDIEKNGNMQVAVEVLNSSGDMKQKAISPTPNAVFKAPFNYYGKIVKITGTVAIVQEYPPDSDISKNIGGSASEIVLMSDDSTFTDYVLKGTTGDLQVGDTATVYGYPCGLVSAPNKMGGTTEELAMIGTAFDKN